ncbi:ankyrin repeat domain-containing protein 13D isoform X2 [Sitodiplosis mosellana]|uniref:ankyrin repeat domain-containing protein 13D isoform X2 n=1 Tax=Sitodiplosis mosellana TaxID=263140 RepID=UPI00244456A3|nr:ankyrin repeat domain-containing protein 13D isoform X2 [Sitodiplosis mosellana]
MTTIEKIQSEYPLHWAVWNDDHKELQELLKTNKHDAEKLDTRGRTPLMLAVRLCHLQSVKVLLAAKCNANAERDGWSVVQEAVCTGDPATLTAILEVRDLQRHIQRTTHVPQLLKKLIDAPDFYVEMKWEFTSWVPLVSRLCPSDVYKVYKRGSNVRIDTTLLGFDGVATWQRGNRTYIFKGDADAATMVEVDHDSQDFTEFQMQSAEFCLNPPERNGQRRLSDLNGIAPTIESVAARLHAPVTSNRIDMDKISFERNKTGIWGWRSDKMENINGYECKVYAASNVEFVTRTRNEHLNETQARSRNSRTPLHSFLGMAEEECSNVDQSLFRDASPIASPDNEVSTSTQIDVPTKALTPEEYFADDDLNGRDVGQPQKVTTKVQRFKANLWLSEEFPIKLQEQVLPILDLMSTMASPHVSKLKDFITMQLPSGFPVRIEIPLFHVLNACVTFGNVFGLETAVKNVENLREEDSQRLSCVIDDSCFDIPSHYTNKTNEYRRQLTFEDEDDLLQYALQQSLIEAGTESEQVDIWEALKAQRPMSPANLTDEDAQLQSANASRRGSLDLNPLKSLRKSPLKRLF